MIIIRGIEQGTPEWHDLRKGVLTASKASTIASNGKGLKTYISDLMAEFYSDEHIETFKNEAMQRGNDLEPNARAWYEFETGETVEEVAFIYLDEDRTVGCSPDGLIVGKEKGVEYKCPSTTEKHEHISKSIDNIPRGWLWQVQMCLYVTKYQSWDFVSYHPDCEKHLVIYEIFPNPYDQKMIEIGIKSGLIQRSEILQLIKGETNERITSKIPETVGVQPNRLQFI